MHTTVEKLARTAVSLRNHIARGNTVTGQRSITLIDRYEALREKATAAEWQAHCAAHGYALQHDAYDFFA